MKSCIVDTNLFFAECLDESDFEKHSDQIIQRANIIEFAGRLAIPLVCWQSEFDQESQYFTYQLGEEFNNLINFMAILDLQKRDCRKWEKVDCWVCESPEQADIVLHQYEFNFE